MEQESRRSRNFSEREKKILLAIIENYIDVLENKKTDQITNKAKDAAWMEISVAFNSNSVEVKRTAGQLKIFYDNHKRKRRKRLRNNEGERYDGGTDGGSCSTDATEVDLKFMPLLKRQFVPKVEVQIVDNEENYQMQEAEKEEEETDFSQTNCSQLLNHALNSTSYELEKSNPSAELEIKKSELEIKKTELEVKKTELEIKKTELETKKIELEIKKIELEIRKIV